MTFGPKKQSDWSSRDALIAARSGSVVLIPSAISKPAFGRVNTSSNLSESYGNPKNTSNKKRLMPVFSQSSADSGSGSE